MTQPIVLFDNEKIRSEYERWLAHFEGLDPYDSDDTVGLNDVLRAHFLVADYFYSKDTGLGGVGPRDSELLHSAIYRQFVSYGGQDKWKTPFERAATLLYGLITDHPFHDANKRDRPSGSSFVSPQVKPYPHRRATPA